MKLQKVAGSTDQTINVFIQDSSATDGSGLTGLAYNTASLVCYYVRPGSAAAALSLATQTATGAHADGGFVEIDSTNMPGWYRLDLSDAVLAAGVDSVGIVLRGAANMAPCNAEIQLTAFDMDTATVTTDSASRIASQADVSALATAVNLATVDSNVDAILVDTGTTLPATLSTISGNVDSILTDTGTTLPGLIAALNDPTAAAIADAVWDEILSGATHNISNSAGKILRDLQENQGYIGYIWIDTLNGTAGTEPYVNGTVNNPVDSLADALTLSASVGITDFQVKTGSAITLTSAVDGYTFTGPSWVLTLNGQSVSGARFSNARVLGNDSGTNALATAYIGCLFNTNTLGYHRGEGCGFLGTITIAEPASYGYLHCHCSGEGVPGVIDLGAAVGDVNINMYPFWGGIQFNNIGATGTDIVSVAGVGQMVLDSSCVGGTLNVCGNFKLTDNSATTTVNQIARVASDTINAAADTAISDAGLSTFDATTDTVDIGAVNGVTVGGAGTEANPWGPA